MIARVLVCAGSDSGAGAGIQADLKTVMALGGYAATAITALTAQDTLGVHGVHLVPPSFVRDQMIVILDDIGADAVKLGMLGPPDIIEAVADVLSERAAHLPIVLDPVMVAKGGASLLPDDAIAAVKRLLFPLATLLTPNLPEAERLLGRRISSPDDMVRAAQELQSAGSTNVLVKGGHLDAADVPNVLATPSGTEIFVSERITTRHTHGTGCTMASAIATGLAQGMTLRDAVVRALDYVSRAIRNAPALGGGHGPLGHLAPDQSARSC